MNIDLDQLRALMRSLNEFDLSELELENSEERIILRRGGAAAHTPIVAQAVPAAQPPAPATTASAAPTEDKDATFITSPFVGTFYRATTPDAPPFVKIGATIEPGQTLCIVEAMKLMNEIESEVNGTIAEVLVENGKPVEYGDRLFRVTTS